MQRESNKYAAGPSDLRQHFHNYFELLLGAERSKLQQAIGSFGETHEQRELLAEIDCRIDYLRGAVRMGRLLCLIDQDEAKSNFGLLSAERDRLRARALAEPDGKYSEPSQEPASSRLASIRNSLRSAAQT
jgi:hypothetical protein